MLFVIALEFKQIWPDQGDWNIAKPPTLLEFRPLFKQIWPDQGDWNVLRIAFFSLRSLDLNKFDPIKGIETSKADLQKAFLARI